MRAFRRSPFRSVMTVAALFFAVASIGAAADEPVQVTVERPACTGEPFAKSVSASLEIGDRRGLFSLIDDEDVPEGRMLVVENVSYDVSVPLGQTAQLVFEAGSILTDELVSQAFMPRVSGFTDSISDRVRYRDSESVRIFVLTEDEFGPRVFRAGIIRSSDVGVASLTFAYSGYLVPYRPQSDEAP